MACKRCGEDIGESAAASGSLTPSARPAPISSGIGRRGPSGPKRLCADATGARRYRNNLPTRTACEYSVFGVVLTDQACHGTGILGKLNEDAYCNPRHVCGYRLQCAPLFTAVYLLEHPGHGPDRPPGFTKTSSTPAPPSVSGSSRKLEEVQSPFQKIEMLRDHRFRQPDGDRRRDDGDHAREFLLSRDDVACRRSTRIAAIRRTSSSSAAATAARCAKCLKHAEVETVVQCDIDEQVTRMAEKYFPELCESNNDPRATVMFDDGIAYMEECRARQHRHHHRGFDRSGRPGGRPVQPAPSMKTASRRCVPMACWCSRANRLWR